MSTTLELAPFTVIVDPNGVTVRTEDGGISFKPAESARLKEITTMTRRMKNLKVLPPHIKMHPFQVEFAENGSCLLRRQDNHNMGVIFNFNNVDTLIDAVDMGVNKLVGELQIRGGARPGVSSNKITEPVLNGR